jgi:ABC-2 type transport system permease protein
MLPLLLGILAISLGSSLLAAEERDSTIESLMARPISRTHLLLHKSLSGALILGLATLVGLAVTLITKWQVDLEVPVRYILVATLSCYLMVLTFGAIALLFTSIGRTRGGAIGLSAVIAIGGYLISSLSSTVSWLEKPSKIFPFEYYDSESILRGTIEWSNFLFFIILTVICLIASIYAFRRRDLA